MSIYRNKKSKIGIELSNSNGVVELLTLNGEVLKEDSK